MYTHLPYCCRRRLAHYAIHSRLTAAQWVDSPLGKWAGTPKPWVVGARRWGKEPVALCQSLCYTASNEQSVVSGLKKPQPPACGQYHKSNMVGQAVNMPTLCVWFCTLPSGERHLKVPHCPLSGSSLVHACMSPLVQFPGPLVDLDNLYCALGPRGLRQRVLCTQQETCEK